MKTPTQSLTGQPPQTVEQIKRDLKKKLEVIFSKQVENNLLKYFDSRLNDITDFLEDVVSEYKLKIEASLLTNKSNREIEDDACAYFEIQNVNEILDLIANKNNLLIEIDKFIEDHSTLDDHIYVPPQTREIVTGSGAGMETKKVWERIQMLFYILRSEGIEITDQNKIEMGSVAGNMFRQEPYYCIHIPQLNRIVLECKEEGNAMFVFDMNELVKPEIAMTSTKLVSLTKDELNRIIEKNPKVGLRIPHRSGWEDLLKENLFNAIKITESEEEPEAIPIEQIKQNELTEIELLDLQLSGVSHSEIDPWKGFATDRHGNHWGSFTICSQKLYGWNYSKLEERLTKIGIKSTPKIKYVDSIKRTWLKRLYCLEELKTVIPTPDQYVKVNGTGEWLGFYVKDNNHYGTMQIVSQKLNQKYGKNLSDTTLSNVWRDNKSKIKTIKNVEGLEHKHSLVFSLEDFELLLLEYFKRPVLSLNDNKIEHLVVDGVEHISLPSLLEILLKKDPVLYKDFTLSTLRNVAKNNSIIQVDTTKTDGRRTYVYPHQQMLDVVEKYAKLPLLKRTEMIVVNGENFASSTTIFNELIKRFGKIKSDQGTEGLTVEGFRVLLKSNIKKIRQIPCRTDKGGLQGKGIYSLEDIIVVLKEKKKI